MSLRLSATTPAGKRVTFELCHLGKCFLENNLIHVIPHGQVYYSSIRATRENWDELYRELDELRAENLRLMQALVKAQAERDLARSELGKGLAGELFKPLQE